MKQIPLTRNLFALVDDEDFEQLNQWKWYAGVKKNGNFCAKRAYQRDNKTYTVFMHRFVMNAVDGQQVDHIDGNQLNNQKVNLRLCTTSENICNRVKQANNTSGYKGVSFSTSCKNPWRAMIGVDYRLVYLGSYPSPLEAAQAYDKAAMEYHGAFASLNFPSV